MPNNLSTWLCLYFGLPVVFWLALYTFKSIWQRDKLTLPSTSSSEGPVFVAVCALVVLLAWPVVFIVLIADGYRLFRSRYVATFWYAQDHLQNQSTIEAAELSAKVLYPLQRTPDVPFGHLNPGWIAFLQEKKEGYVLYAFTSPGYPPAEPWESGPKWSTYRYRKLGYAWVKSGKIKAEFIYEWD